MITRREAAIEVFSDRVQPHSPGLADRMWYGGGSLRSCQWAGEHGMNLLTSSVVKTVESEDFEQIRSHVRAFRAAHPYGQAAPVSQGLVVTPPTRPAPNSAPSARSTPRIGRNRRAAVRARRVPLGR
ncbi:hypothetical protein [Catellatospora tritici]|uniref:hypothetical protein n=1 Tax=Catellatospora tritici TaxID=2851566 RepID=UPI0020C55C2E|nr:hypothetical protein [Catellatospora tritici]